MTNQYNLPEHILKELKEKKNKDGTPLSDAQIEEQLDLIARYRTLDVGQKEEPEQVKINKVEKPKTVEASIYQNTRRQNPQTRSERDVQDLERNLQSSGVEVVQPIDLSQYQPKEVFILSNDDFGKTLVSKVNEKYQGKVKIPNLRNNQEIPVGNILVSSAYRTVIFENEELNKLGFYPITPLQSESLLQSNKLQNYRTSWTDLALILYDISDKGCNPKEAEALKESLTKYKSDLNLTNQDLEQRLLIVNPGLESDASFPLGVKLVVLPGLTKAYVHETLKQTGRNHKFSFGSDNGLPSISELEKGSRTLYMPEKNSEIGLRVLCRDWGLYLNSRCRYLDYSSEGGRVPFAKKIS